MDTNKISISLEDYPDLLDEAKGAGPGDKVTVKITFTVDESSDDMIVGSIVGVNDSETKADDKEESDGEYDKEAAVFTVMGKK